MAPCQCTASAGLLDGSHLKADSFHGTSNDKRQELLGMMSDESVGDCKHDLLLLKKGLATWCGLCKRRWQGELTCWMGA